MNRATDPQDPTASSVDSLPGASDDERRSLRAAGYGNTDYLWDAISDHGFDKIGGRAQICPRRLAVLLAASEVAEVRRARRPLRDHLSALVLQLAWSLALATVLGAALFIGASLQEVVKTSRSSTYAVVAAASGVPAFHTLQPGDIKTVVGPEGAADLADPKSVAGLYTLQTMPTGTAIRRSHLGNRPLDSGALRDRVTLSLETSTSRLTNVRAPQPVLLIFAPLPDARAASSGEPEIGEPEIIEALLLNVVPAGERARVEVAIPESEVLRVGRVAGRSQLLVVTRTPASR